MTMSSSSHAKSASRTKNIICSPWKTYAEERNEHFDAQRAIRSHAHNARYKKIPGSIIITGRPTHMPHYVANATLFNAMGLAENYSKGKCFRQILSRTRKNAIRRFAASCAQKKTMEFSWDKRHSIAESELSYTHVQK